jgi:hypothetical protein
MADKYTHEELVDRLNSPGWRLVIGNPTFSVSGTLEKMLATAHERKSSGGAPGLIAEIETSIELEMLQIEKLWLQMGLPT